MVAPRQQARGGAPGRVCLVSGGTGGHLMPALVLARSLLDGGQEPLLVTEGRDVERELVRRELPNVDSVEVPRSGRSPAALPWWMTRATSRAREAPRRNNARDGVLEPGARPAPSPGIAASDPRR